MQKEHLDLKCDLPVSVAQTVTDAALSDSVLFGVDAKLLDRIFDGLSDVLSRMSVNGVEVCVLYPACPESLAC